MLMAWEACGLSLWEAQAEDRVQKPSRRDGSDEQFTIVWLSKSSVLSEGSRELRSLRVQ
jgi:hypothetical protein